MILKMFLIHYMIIVGITSPKHPPQHLYQLIFILLIQLSTFTDEFTLRHIRKTFVMPFSIW